MRREPVRLEALARALFDFRVGITRDFPRRLAWLTARVEDDRIRSVLAKQLNDELGDGDFTRAHRGSSSGCRGARALGSAGDGRGARSGPRARRGAGALLREAEPYEGVGASLVVEVYGKQVDTFIADQFRRQTQIPPSALEWLHLHEILEVEHADESMDMARVIPYRRRPARPPRRGAKAVATASRAFFDALYRECYR